jgi:hypothetical protein
VSVCLSNSRPRIARAEAAQRLDRVFESDEQQRSRLTAPFTGSSSAPRGGDGKTRFARAAVLRRSSLRSPQRADSAHAVAVGHQAGRADLIRSALAGTPGGCKHRAVPAASAQASSPAARSGHDFGVGSQASGYPVGQQRPRAFRSRRRAAAPIAESRAASQRAESPSLLCKSPSAVPALGASRGTRALGPWRSKCRQSSRAPLDHRRTIVGKAAVSAPRTADSGAVRMSPCCGSWSVCARRSFKIRSTMSVDDQPSF